MKMVRKDNKNSKDMRFHGIGPKMLVILLPFIIILAIIDFFCYPFFHIPIDPLYFFITGIVLLAIGLYIYFKSIIAVKKAFDNNQFLITGFYGHMRHPVYSSFILFITPGIFLFTMSWLLYSIPFILYIIFHYLIKQEENYCVRIFGEKYNHYKENVYAIIPKFKKYKLSKKSNKLKF